MKCLTTALAVFLSKSATPPAYLLLLRTLTLMQVLPVSHDALQLHLQDPSAGGYGNKDID